MELSTLSAIEKHLIRSRKRVVKMLAMIDKTAALLSNGASEPKPRVAKKRKTNGKVTRARQLQGRYIGSIRMLTKTQRKQVAKTREAKGYIAAISQAKQMAKEAAKA